MVASRPVSGVLYPEFRTVAIHLRGLPGDIGRAARPTVWPCSEWGLPSRPSHPGRWCALTAPFHPYLCPKAIGGLFSVALSCGSPRLAVSQHPALWSPDFPRRRTNRAPRPPGRLAADILALAHVRVDEAPPRYSPAVARDPEVQRFDFGEADEVQPPARADELVARVEAVHAVASRGRKRRQQVDVVVESYLAEYPLEGFAEGESEGRSAVPPAESEAVVGEAAPREDAETLTIAAFYDRVRYALRASFPDEVWVSGEIRGLREARGHRYIELVDADSEPGARQAAQLEVVCWSRDWPPIGRELREAGLDLEVGRVIRVRGRVSVWDGGSKLRFTLTALDVEALLGNIAANRRRLLATLEVEGLLGRNRALPLPLVPLRIGLVASPGTEGHRDFVGQLERSGFAFDVQLVPSLVQGPDAPDQLARALERLAPPSPDLVVIVRGGGARGDLAAFDAEEVARAIALAPFPVWVGVGHTGDRSVADEVAHASWITPTACGEAVVDRVTAYWSEVERRMRTIASEVRSRLVHAGARAATAESGLARAVRHQVERRLAANLEARRAVARSAAVRVATESDRASRRAEALSAVAVRGIEGEVAHLERRRQVLGAFDPQRQLARGWSLTHRDGVLVRSIDDVEDGMSIVTRVADGEFTATVNGSESGTDRQRAKEAG